MIKKTELQNMRIKKKKISNNNKYKINIDEAFKKFVENNNENNNFDYKISNKNINYQCYNTNFNFPIIKNDDENLISEFDKINLFKNNINTNRKFNKNSKNNITNNNIYYQKKNNNIFDDIIYGDLK